MSLDLKSIPPRTWALVVIAGGAIGLYLRKRKGSSAGGSVGSATGGASGADMSGYALQGSSTGAYAGYDQGYGTAAGTGSYSGMSPTGEGGTPDPLTPRVPTVAPDPTPSTTPTQVAQQPLAGESPTQPAAPQGFVTPTGDVHIVIGQSDDNVRRVQQWFKTVNPYGLGAGVQVTGAYNDASGLPNAIRQYINNATGKAPTENAFGITQAELQKAGV